MNNKINMFNLEFENVNLQNAAGLVIDLVKKGKKNLVVTPNVDHIISIQDDMEMMNIFQNASYRFCDGMPLVWLSRLIFGKKEGLCERVTGADLLFEISKLAAEKGVEIFYAGGEEGVAVEAGIQLKKLYPSLKVSGTYCPPWGFEVSQTISNQFVNMVNDSHAKILFLGVGTPKQEKWAATHLEELDCNVVIGVGAALDFAAGNVKRSPTIMSNMGLEWLWRLGLEPRRLWRRYLLRGSRFFGLALKEYRSLHR